MRNPEDACFKQQSPFLSLTTTTTTTTTQEPDFFILPTSGIACPEIYVDDGQLVIPETPFNNDIVQFICSSEALDPNPCVLESLRYIRIADINIETSRCKKYKLRLTPISLPTTTTTTTTTINGSTTTTTTEPPILNCSYRTIKWGNIQHGPSTTNLKLGNCANNIEVYSPILPPSPDSYPIKGTQSYLYRWNTFDIYSGDFPNCIDTNQNNNFGSTGYYQWTIFYIAKILDEWKSWVRLIKYSQSLNINIYTNPTFETVDWYESDMIFITNSNNQLTRIVLKSKPTFGSFPTLDPLDPKLFSFSAIPGLQQDGTIAFDIVCRN